MKRQYPTFKRLGFKFFAHFSAVFFLLQLSGFQSFSDTAFGQNFLIEDKAKINTDLKPTDVIHWESVAADAYKDGRISIGIRLRTEQEFTLYTDKVSFTPPAGFVLEKMTPPPVKSIIDPVMGKTVDVYYGGEFELIYKSPESGSKAIPDIFPLKVKYLGCTTRICLFPHTETLELKVFRKDVPLIQQAVIKSQPEPNKFIEEEEEEEVDLEAGLVKRLQDSELSLWMLLLIIFVGGLATNLTPCVYPMIPITIRVLAGQSKSPIAASSAYASGILLTYTSLGVFAALTGSLFGVIMASSAFNLIFGAAMIGFGISMLGFGNFSALQTVGSKIGTGKASLKNAFLMGTGAGLVASPCTGPVLAFLLAYSAKQSDVSQSILLLFIYSLGFALPYVFLGGLAAKASAIKVSPRIQIAVKTIFAAVMVGLGLYYLRIPAYGLVKTLAETWPIIAKITLSIGIFTTIVSLAIPAIYEKKNLLLIPALTLGMGIFSGSQWLTTSQTLAASEHINWIKSEKEGLALAKKLNAPVLIDAWAEWCEACKKMDGTTFSDPRVIKLLNDKKFVMIKLDLTESTDETDRLMAKYEIHSLPTLTVLHNGGTLDDKMSILGFVSSAVLINKITMFETE